MGYFRFFFTHSRFFTTLYPTLCVKKKLQKIPSNYYLCKVKKFHGNIVKNESASAKKNRGGGRQRPPPSPFSFNNRAFRFLIKLPLDAENHYYCTVEKNIYSRFACTLNISSSSLFSFSVGFFS